MLKKTLRNYYMKRKLQEIKNNAYHSGLKSQLIKLLKQHIPSDQGQLVIGSYIFKPYSQQIIVPEFSAIDFGQEKNRQFRIAYPSFKKKTKKMFFHIYRAENKNNYTNSVYGIKNLCMDPKIEEASKVDKIDILLVPLTAFDSQSKQRIGYGGGYYDQFIRELRSSKSCKKSICIGIGLECLKIEDKSKSSDIFGEWDQNLDYIATQKHIY